MDCILLKALRREPQLRYASAAAFAADIEAFQAHRPVAARGGATLYVTKHFIHRHRERIAAALALAAALSWGGMEKVRADRQNAHMVKHDDNEKAIGSLAQGGRTIPASELAGPIREIGRDYTDVFPKLVSNPFSSSDRNRELVEHDLTWLDQVGKIVPKEPEIAPDLANTYLNIAKAQFSSDAPSLKDREGSEETVKSALGVLAEAPKDYDPATIQTLLEEIQLQQKLLDNASR
jgi:hypothetical protein